MIGCLMLAKVFSFKRRGGAQVLTPVTLRFWRIGRPNSWAIVTPQILAARAPQILMQAYFKEYLRFPGGDRNSPLARFFNPKGWSRRTCDFLDVIEEVRSPDSSVRTFSTTCAQVIEKVRHVHRISGVRKRSLSRPASHPRTAQTQIR